MCHLVIHHTVMIQQYRALHIPSLEDCMPSDNDEQLNKTTYSEYE